MSLLCLLCVPWQGLAPLLTPQTRVTQPLSSAYSHPAYPLGVWGGGGAGPIPDRLEPLSHRELLFFFGGDTVLALSKDQQGNLNTMRLDFQPSRVPAHEQAFQLGFVSVCGRTPCAWHCPKHLTRDQAIEPV